MARMNGELGDEEWNLLGPLLPHQDGPGHPWRDHRQVIEGVLWIVRTGAPWRDLPVEFGPWQTAYERFSRWRSDGTWNRLLETLQSVADQKGVIDWSLFAVDSSNIRASRAAAGAGKRGGPTEPQDHALGRSRGGFGSKIHLVCERGGALLSVIVTPGERHDSTQFQATLGQVRIKRSVGRPRFRPKAVAADKAYSTRQIRCWLGDHGIQAVIPLKKDQLKREAQRPGRRIKFDAHLYKLRNVIERSIGWLKENRRVATRFEKLALNFVQIVKLAILKRYLRVLVRVGS